MHNFIMLLISPCSDLNCDQGILQLYDLMLNNEGRETVFGV